MPIARSLPYPRTHRFQIPVMGTGHSIDTPLRVARWGISSVISLVDDVLCEQVHGLHAQRLSLPFEPVNPRDPEARTLRVAAWLDFMADRVNDQMAYLRSCGFEESSPKDTWFRRLPSDSPLRARWEVLRGCPSGPEREREADALTEAMEPGSIDANIMTKLDRRPIVRGTPVDASLSDARQALRGFALASRHRGHLVLSAGINPTLYGAIAEQPGFFRSAHGEAPKGIIIKVSDLRSALTQGRFLARKGLEVREFRIESGLNCGGHAFATDGELLLPILEDFQADRASWTTDLARAVAATFTRQGREVPLGTLEHEPALNVQGGLGAAAEQRRLLDHFQVDATGWGSPFLLVPEATPVDERTRSLLAAAGPGDVYLSDASPLGVPFNNLRGSTAEQDLKARLREGRPGSTCPKGYLVSNTTYSSAPVCTASRFYQSKRLAELGGLDASGSDSVTVKECICHQLGNGALEFIARETAALRGEPDPGPMDAPVSVCPGPNIVWFKGIYSLDQMLDHIYGRGPSLVPAHRPHMQAQELDLYIEHYNRLRMGAEGSAGLESFRVNLLAGILRLRSWVRGLQLLPNENLESLLDACDRAEQVLHHETFVEAGLTVDA